MSIKCLSHVAGERQLIVMDAAQAVALCKAAPNSTIIATHIEALARMALYGLGVFERFGEIVDQECTAEFRRTGFLALVGPL